jgi:heptosyltransferase-2
MGRKDLIYRSECRFFRGDIPCRPHKEYGVHCEDCSYYEAIEEHILIIKLGAIGDVIRTTPLIEKIRKEYPKAFIWWVTYSPAVVPGGVDRVLKLDPESILTLGAVDFDIAINLDKDPHACGLLENIKAAWKYGYKLKNGRPAPFDSKARHKFMTGIFDDVNQANKKSYLEEIFEICGWEFNGEEYRLEYNSDIEWSIPADGKPIVGLNTGCGERWTSRLWADENWEKLIEMLIRSGYFPLLLGGEQEHEKNSNLAFKTGATYLGHFPLQDFISLVDRCDVIVSAVTMAMHLAIGLKKRLVLMNNIFNPNEFELYGRGEIVSPDKPCTCFFRPKCVNEEYFCMDHLPPTKIYEAVERQIAELKD